MPGFQFQRSARGTLQRKFKFLHSLHRHATLNIKVFNAPNTRVSIKKVIDLYRKGELEPMTSANVASHYGMGGGRGAGGRHGMVNRP